MSRRAPPVVLVTMLAFCSNACPPEALADTDVSQWLWSGNHARPIPRGRVELGLFSSSHYGVGNGVELSLHPLWFFALPHVEAKALAAARGPLSLAARGRLAYPTPFLGLVSREGAGGLLPATSSPPQALQIEGDLLATWAPSELHALSASVGLAVAPHESFTAQELPLLDFPFLYPRFAPLYTVLVPRMGVGLEGRLFATLFYEVSGIAYLMPSLPDVGTTYAIEEQAALEYRFGRRLALALGLRTSEAGYAQGNRLHLLPYADVRAGF